MLAEQRRENGHRGGHSIIDNGDPSGAGGGGNPSASGGGRSSSTRIRFPFLSSLTSCGSGAAGGGGGGGEGTHNGGRSSNSVPSSMISGAAAGLASAVSERILAVSQVVREGALDEEEEDFTECADDNVETPGLSTVSQNNDHSDDVEGNGLDEDGASSSSEKSKTGDMQQQLDCGP